jgi:hypothetical protein
MTSRQVDATLTPEEKAAMQAAPTTGAPAAAATAGARVCRAEEDAPENGELAASGRSRRTRLLRDWLALTLRRRREAGQNA